MQGIRYLLCGLLLATPLARGGAPEDAQALARDFYAWVLEHPSAGIPRAGELEQLRSLLSPALLAALQDAARAEAARLGHANVRFEVADAARLPERDAFDLVTTFDAVHDLLAPGNQVWADSASALVVVAAATTGDLSRDARRRLVTARASIGPLLRWPR